MRFFSSIPTTLAICLVFHAGMANANDEKEEMKRTAEEYRKCAIENKNAKLDDCEKNSPEIVKAAATKVVASHQKLGAIEDQLAAAYEAGDRKGIQQLHNQKNDVELECELFSKEKRVAYVVSTLDDLILSVPESPDAKKLKAKTEADLKAYLENAKKLMELQKEQTRMGKCFETIDSSIEIIKKREELKKLEEEAAQSR